jgi:hypothetical protein
VELGAIHAVVVALVVALVAEGCSGPTGSPVVSVPMVSGSADARPPTAIPLPEPPEDPHAGERTFYTFDTPCEDGAEATPRAHRVFDDGTEIATPRSRVPLAPDASERVEGAYVRASDRIWQSVAVYCGALGLEGEIPVRIQRCARAAMLGLRPDATDDGPRLGRAQATVVMDRLAHVREIVTYELKGRSTPQAVDLVMAGAVCLDVWAVSKRPIAEESVPASVARACRQDCDRRGRLRCEAAKRRVPSGGPKPEEAAGVQAAIDAACTSPLDDCVQRCFFEKAPSGPARNP